MTTFIGSSLSSGDRPVRAHILDKTGVTHNWDLTGENGILIDPDVSVAKATVSTIPAPPAVEGEEQGQEQKSIRIYEIIPWTQVVRVWFEYDEGNTAAATVN